MLTEVRKKILFPFLAFASLLIIWEMFSYASAHLFLVLPSPSSVFMELLDKTDQFIFHGKATLKVMLGGCALAFAIAFPFAWIMFLSNNARLILQPLLVITQCVPMFALAPIMVIWFGWTYSAIVIPTALMIFFPLTMSLYQGLRATPTHLIDYFKSQQATKWQTFYKLQLPWALPHIFAGLRISAAAAGIGAIAGEWAGAQSGLGLLMLESRRGSDLEITFGALFCLTVISLTLYGTITLIERSIFSRKFVHLVRKTSTACIVIAGFCLTSCSNEQPTSETRMVLDWLPNANHVPVYVGIEKGFFKDEGINLTLRKIHDAGSPLPYLGAGNVELAVSYQPTMLRANTRGGNFVPIGILIPEPLNAIIYRTDSNIKTPKDLNNRIIGYCIDGTATLTLDYLLKTNGIVPKEKRNVSFDLVSSLGSSQVDAVYGAYWNIECEQLKYLGIDTAHFTLKDLGYPNYYELIVVARGDSIQAEPAFTEPFQRAMQKSIEYSKSNPKESFTIYLKANPDKGNKMRVWEEAAWMRTYPLLPNTQKIDHEAWQSFADWIAKTKFG